MDAACVATRFASPLSLITVVFFYKCFHLSGLKSEDSTVVFESEGEGDIITLVF